MLEEILELIEHLDDKEVYKLQVYVNNIVKNRKRRAELRKLLAHKP